MTDVEKYGLFAVVFVGGLLLVIATQGGFGDGGANASGPDLIDSATPLRSPAPGTGKDASKVRVVSVLPSTPFRWEEPPVSYPGPRSIHVPPAAAASTAEGASSAPGTHVVAKGETLSDIAKRHLGSAQRWKDLLAMNPGVDPKKLKPGQVLRVAGSPPVARSAQKEVARGEVQKPDVSPPASATRSGNRSHTVAKGDTLGEIAQRYLGSAQRADDIFRANTDVLKTKNDLKIGQVLRIP
ncbi:MAG: LysM peptidoglycan-binding domain-containing protein [Planctomycetota bacterium]